MAIKREKIINQITLEKQFLFIIGAPRSGTTWLQAMLASHPSVCSTTDELKLFDLFTGPWVNSWNLLLGLRESYGAGAYGLTNVWTEDEFYQFLREFVDRVYARVLSLNPQAEVLLDKAPGYSTYVEHINRIIPHAKFIHLVRDGRDVVVSLQAASKGWGKVWAPKRIESAVELWKTSVMEARKASQYSGRYLEVRYEDLLTKGIPTLQTAFEFTGVPIDRETAEKIYKEHSFEYMQEAGVGVRSFELPKGFFRKGQAGEWRHQLRPKERYVVNDAAGDLLCALGYADESWWIQRQYQRFTLPPLAILSSRNRMRLKVLQSIQWLVGTEWTDRIRAVKRWLKLKVTKQISQSSSRQQF